MIVLKIWDNIKHQYQLPDIQHFIIVSVKANIISIYNNHRSSNEKLFDDHNISRFVVGVFRNALQVISMQILY